MSNTHVIKFLGHNLRILLREGAPWFVATDICGILDLRKGSTTAHLSSLDAKDVWKATFQDLKDGMGSSTAPIRAPRSLKVPIILISEPGLYRLALKSRKPEAKEFQDWITNDVIPTIRTTGTYTKPAALPVPIVDDVRQIAALLRQEADLLIDIADAKDIVREGKAKVVDIRKARIALERSRAA